MVRRGSLRQRAGLILPTLPPHAIGNAVKSPTLVMRWLCKLRPKRPFSDADPWASVAWEAQSPRTAARADHSRPAPAADRWRPGVRHAGPWRASNVVREVRHAAQARPRSSASIVGAKASLSMYGAGFASTQQNVKAGRSACRQGPVGRRAWTVDCPGWRCSEHSTPCGSGRNLWGTVNHSPGGPANGVKAGASTVRRTITIKNPATSGGSPGGLLGSWARHLRANCASRSVVRRSRQWQTPAHRRRRKPVCSAPDCYEAHGRVGTYNTPDGAQGVGCWHGP